MHTLLPLPAEDQRVRMRPLGSEPVPNGIKIGLNRRVTSTCVHAPTMGRPSRDSGAVPPSGMEFTHGSKSHRGLGPRPQRPAGRPRPPHDRTRLRRAGLYQLARPRVGPGHHRPPSPSSPGRSSTGNTPCTEVRHLAGRPFTASAWCQARARLPLAVLQTPSRRVAEAAMPPHASGATPVAGPPPHVPRRRLELLHARHAAAPRGVRRPADRAEGGLRLPHGPPARAVQRGHRAARRRRRLAPPYRRRERRARPSPPPGPRRRAGRRRQLRHLRPPGAAAGGGVARPVPRAPQADRRLHARPAGRTAPRAGRRRRRRPARRTRGSCGRWASRTNWWIWFKPKQRPRWMDAERYARPARVDPRPRAAADGGRPGRRPGDADDGHDAGRPARLHGRGAAGPAAAAVGRGDGHRIPEDGDGHGRAAVQDRGAPCARGWPCSASCTTSSAS